VCACVLVCVRVFVCVCHMHTTQQREGHSVCACTHDRESSTMRNQTLDAKHTKNPKPTTYHTCSSGELCRRRYIFGSLPAPTSKLARATQRRAKVGGALITPTFYILDHYHYHDANYPRWEAPSCCLQSCRQKYGQIRSSRSLLRQKRPM
jgi:hypothetical protein